MEKKALLPEQKQVTDLKNTCYMSWNDRVLGHSKCVNIKK